MQQIWSRLLSGDIRPYQLDEIIFHEVYNGDGDKWESAAQDAAGLRLRFLEEKTGKRFAHLQHAFVNVADRKKMTIGIEQQIGAAMVPLGFAGPVAITGEYAKGEFFIPCASNEAAQIAGMNRGIKVINAAGGIRTVVTKDQMTRAPVIEAPTISDANLICRAIGEKGELYGRMKEAAERESRVSRLINIQPFQFGTMVHLRFSFQTGDSMGMNSATKYAANAVQVLLAACPAARLVSLSGNLCTDKKATHTNVLLGRGKSVEAEVSVPLSVLQAHFNGLDPRRIARLNRIKNYEGSALAGTISGFNANAANAIAALFIATGQDAAQIVESASCFTRAEVEGDTLVFGVTLPSLEVATVGGGTGFGTAKDCLELLGCAGPGTPAGSHAKKLAEIIAAAVTAQELNLLAAEANRYELADSHVRLARGTGNSGKNPANA